MDESQHACCVLHVWLSPALPPAMAIDCWMLVYYVHGDYCPLDRFIPQHLARMFDRNTNTFSWLYVCTTSMGVCEQNGKTRSFCGGIGAV